MNNKNIRLRTLRASYDLTQEEFAERAGVSRAVYSMVECGMRKGKAEFWAAIQRAYSIPSAEMWALINNETR